MLDAHFVSFIVFSSFDISDDGTHNFQCEHFSIRHGIWFTFTWNNQLSVSGQLFLSFASNERELFASLAQTDGTSKRCAYECHKKCFCQFSKCRKKHWKCVRCGKGAVSVEWRYRCRLSGGQILNNQFISKKTHNCRVQRQKWSRCAQ